jgi:NADH dehydrogenase
LDRALRDAQPGSVPPDCHRPRIVIIGAGFGGLATAKALARVDANVTIVDRHNYHLFLITGDASADLPKPECFR